MKRCFKSITGMVMALLLILGNILPAAAETYKNGDSVVIVHDGVWAFHGGRQSGETSSTSNGGNRANHYNNRLYWYDGNSIDILTLQGDKYTPQYNGKYYAYCIHHGQGYGNSNRVIKMSANGNIVDSTYWTQLGKNKQQLLGQLSIHGFPAQTPAQLGVSTVDDAYAATQVIAWEITQGYTAATKCTSDLYKHYILYAYTGNGHTAGDRTPAYTAYINIWNAIAGHGTKGSFDGQTLTLKWDASAQAYKGSITDTNGVVSGSVVSGSLPSGISGSKSGNTISFSTAAAIVGTTRVITYQRNFSDEISKSAPFAVLEGGSDAQEMMCGTINDPVWYNIRLRTATGTLRIVKTSADGIIAGLQFRITGNGLDQTVTTGSDGTISQTLPAGTYTVSEVNVPDRYKAPASQTVTVADGQTATVSFYNGYKYGKLSLKKTSEDGQVAGISFQLTGSGVDRTVTTDQSGSILVEQLLPGTYTLTEITADQYVIPASQTVTVTAGQTATVSFSNVLKKWKLTVEKRDGETGTAQGDGALAGAVYGVYRNGMLQDRYTTDAAGSFTTKEYLCGDGWTLREITPSEGYLLDETVYPIGAAPGSFTAEHNTLRLTVREQVAKGRVSIVKHTDHGITQIETPEVGAAFEVYHQAAGSYAAAKESERDRLVCDENGYAESRALPFGVYTVHQTKSWDGRYPVEDFTVQIAEDGKVYRYIINNAAFYSHVRIVKTDAETGNAIPYAGAGFKLYRPDGSPVTFEQTYPTHEILDTFYTTGDGSLLTPDRLIYGIGYQLVEVQAPIGYVLDETPIVFDITEENSQKDGNLTVVTVERPNAPQKGAVTLIKTGEVFAGVTEQDGVYTPVFEKRQLAGAVYALIAAKDIVTPDGTVRALVGETVAMLTSEADAPVMAQGLYLGSYQLVEQQAPAGHVRNPEPVAVELTYAGQTQAVTLSDMELHNDRQKVRITLEKVLETDERYTLGEVYRHVQFGLYAAEDLIAADGSILPVDGLICVTGIDADGHGAFDADLPYGSYYVKEFCTNVHYKLNDTVYPADFSPKADDVPVVEIAINNGEAIHNTLQRGSLKRMAEPITTSCSPSPRRMISHPKPHMKSE